MFDGPASERSEARRALFADLIDATLPLAEGVDGRKVLAWRINAKFAHAALLQRARFSTEPAPLRQAKRLADGHLALCEAMLLS
ncbi:hypothetical protein [Poseidonocella sedimentorum]|uniref:Uncharacterized protein n=1 Tax=Poseidonocella sedimentorum TaxID=871652 RepID=A0A1I6CP75_9RHOB|nr:hypothetical protein [Poseidonocella sedimentorum]SFQ94974.1 hypothetical protein SAMN04515673_101132 [Poseidonocella sedimentorum]